MSDIKKIWIYVFTPALICCILFIMRVYKVNVPAFLTDSVPAALWLFSVLILIEILLKHKSYRHIIAVIIFFLNILIELFQDYFLPGTFCNVDCVMYWIAFMTFLWIRKKWNIQMKQKKIVETEEHVDWTRF